MCECCDREHQSGNSSSFMFGLLLGAIIGAVIAIIIYKNNKNEVLVSLKEKLEKYFKNIFDLVNPNTTEKVVKKTVKTNKTKIIVKTPIKPVEKKSIKLIEKPVEVKTPVAPKITYVTAKPKKSAPKMFVKSRK